MAIRTGKLKAAFLRTGTDLRASTDRAESAPLASSPPHPAPSALNRGVGERAGLDTSGEADSAIAPPSLMQVEQGDRSVLLMQHHLCHVSQAKDVVSSVHAHLDAGSVEVIELNLEQMDSLTSSALNELICLNNRAKSCGVRLVLTNMAANLRDIFAITRLERMFELG